MIKNPAVTAEELWEIMDDEMASEIGGKTRAFLVLIAFILSFSMCSMIVFALSMTELRYVYDFVAEHIMDMAADSAHAVTENAYPKFVVACIALGLFCVFLVFVFIKMVRKLHKLFMSPFSAEQTGNTELIAHCQNALQLLSVIEDMKVFLGERSGTFRCTGESRHTVEVIALDEEGEEEAQNFFFGSAWDVRQFISEDASILDFSRITVMRPKMPHLVFAHEE